MRKSFAPSNRIGLLNKTTNCPRRSTSDVLKLLNVKLNNLSPAREQSDDKFKYTNSPNTSKVLNTTNSLTNLSEAREADVVDVASNSIANESYWAVLWSKPTTKKHKTWEGDGTLHVVGCVATLHTENGTTLGSARELDVTKLEPGNQLRVGGKEIEIIELLSSKPNSIKRPLKDEEEKHNKTKKLKASNTASKVLSHSSVSLRKGKYQVARLEDKNLLIFPLPSDEHQWKHNTRKVEVRNVILDDFLNRVIRPHQRDGIIFLYECVMGYRHEQYHGAILADEMGLGKTLQSIGLIWTLLKQGPYGWVTCKQVLIITPSSLCLNWEREMLRWLGRERVKPYVVDRTHKAVDFKNYPMQPVMLVSYELFVRNFSVIQNINFDLIICDEGHRLKNSSSKAAQLLSQLTCKKRILLTGTPIQNDLQEYFALIDVVNPGILGTYAQFKKDFELPIIASRELNSDTVLQITGQQSAAQLNRITSKFILRRMQDVINKYLPTKTDVILCCRMTRLQIDMYERLIESWYDSSEKNALDLIIKLKKLCTHPTLVTDCFASETISSSTSLSGKLKVVESILMSVAIDSGEKIVLVSYSTKVLDLLAIMCQGLNLQCLRLDGSTPVQQRQSLVNLFNSSGGAQVFLLSARAGGVGLNLIGASCLILVDGDWNPSNDLQAAARIWRDGQKKDVVIYRIMATGTIEEKIYQRQMSKIGLSDAIEDLENVKMSLKFSDAELKDLFSPCFETVSVIHDALDCMCRLGAELDPEDENAENVGTEKSKNEISSGNINTLKFWEHHYPPFSQALLTEISISEEDVTFIFKKKQTFL